MNLKSARKSINSVIIIVVGLLIAGGNISCAIRKFIPLPTAAVAEEEQLPAKVAILPFVNKTSNPEAGTVVRKMFYNFFSSLNYLDLEPFVIDDTLKGNDLYQAVSAGEDVSPQKLGQLLGVDAVIYGEVLHLGKIYALVYSDNQAGLHARMVRCNSGQTVWDLEHSIHLEEGDVPLTPLGLAATVLKTAISHQQATHLKAASELCMQMVATIPNPPTVTEPPPRIQALVHNGAGKLLRPGDYLRVAMIGDKNQVATWSIPPLVENLPMKEKEPGVYIGAYKIKQRDRLPQGRLFGYLRSNKGTGNQWVDTLGPLKIGEPTLLPPIISKNHTLNAGKSPYLVNDALLVMPGATLTVNPGTVIWFRSLGLIVKGELQILGTPENPVQLASLDTSNWKGIFIDRSRMENKISNCIISNAEFGFRATNARVSIQNCQFQDNVWGIVMEEGSAEISRSLIRTSSKTGIAARKARILVKDSVVTENSSGGFLLENSEAQIAQNNIMNNGGWGIKVLDDKSRVQAANNWWGHEGPGETQIIGPATVKPVLKAPVDFSLSDYKSVQSAIRSDSIPRI